MRMKSFKALKSIRHKFVDQKAESKKEEQARLRRIEEKLRTERENYKAQQLADAEQSSATATKEANKAISKFSKKYPDHQEIRTRDLAVEELLSLALHHVTHLNSFDTAKRILTRANMLLPSEVNIRRFANSTNKNPIRRAYIALNNLIKVSKKKKYRTGGKYDPTHAKQHWKNAFNEAIQDAFLEVRIDIHKREGTFFSSINTMTSDLPVVMSESKKYITRTSPLVVNVKGSLKAIHPDAKPRLIEGKLVLLNNVNLIGLRATPAMRATKGQIKDANEIAGRKFEATVYPIPIARPSQNIMWFLVLDFGVAIDAAMFTEHMSTSGIIEAQSPIVASNLSDFIQRFTAVKEQHARMQMQVNRELRLNFERDHAEMYDLIRTNQTVLDALIEKKKQLEEEFASLTSFDGDSQGGLPIRSYNTKFDDFFIKFIRRQIATAAGSLREARLAAIDQRIEARYIYWLHNEVLIEASKLRSRIHAIQEQLKFEKLRLLRSAA